MNQTVFQYWSSLGKLNCNLTNDDVSVTKTRIKKIRKDTYNVESDKLRQDCIWDVDINFDIVTEVICRAKNNKAPGIYGITNELIKNVGVQLHKSLYEFLCQNNHFWKYS